MSFNRADKVTAEQILSRQRVWVPANLRSANCGWFAHRIAKSSRPGMDDLHLGHMKKRGDAGLYSGCQRSCSKCKPVLGALCAVHNPLMCCAGPTGCRSVGFTLGPSPQAFIGKSEEFNLFFGRGAVHCCLFNNTGGFLSNVSNPGLLGAWISIGADQTRAVLRSGR